MHRTIHRTFALVAAFVLAAFLTTAAQAAPKQNASDAKVMGTITQLTKDKITIRADGKDTEIALDGKKTMTVGRPVVDKQATVWYKKGPNGTLWATKIEVPQNAKASTDPNVAVPDSGKLDGTVAKFSKYQVTVRGADSKEWKFQMDGKHTMTMGKLAADAKVSVWYKKDKGNLWATKIQVNK